MHLPLLNDILILLISSVAIVFILQRLKLPSIIGLLLTGVIIGPYGLSLIEAVEQVEILAEIGVILLLFVIGMELSLKQLSSIKKTVFVAGFLQVGLTALIAAGVYNYLGNSWNEAVFIGFLFSLSSTAIVLKTLQDRNQMSSAHAKNALAILIFQDIIVVPMMLVTPLIAGDSANITADILSLLVKTIVLLVFTYVSAKYLVPKLLHAVALTGSKELFLLVTITLCFAVAFLTSEAGLSLALGAFIAGIIISESEYSHQATSIILPFRELFTSFFFVSIGMLLDLSFFASHILDVAALVLVVFVVKTIVAAISVAVLKYPPRTVFLTGLALFQVGEFAFILSQVGLQYELLDTTTNQYFLSVSIVSMLLTPFVIMYSDSITEKLMYLTEKIGIGKRTRKKNNVGQNPDKDLSNHLVIIGYGINGSNLAKAAVVNNIPYFAIEMNAQIVKEESEKGVPIMFGDARHMHILETVRLNKARAAVVAISDKSATKAVVQNIRELSSSLYLIVRTRYVREIPELLALGADEVIPEEFETSVQIFSRVLQNFLVPEEDIKHMIDEVRDDNYQVFQSDQKRPKTFKPNNLSDFNITCLEIGTDSSEILSKPLKEINLRAKFGINVLGIKRRDELLDGVKPEDELHQGDLVYVLGSPDCIDKFHKEIR